MSERALAVCLCIEDLVQLSLPPFPFAVAMACELLYGFDKDHLSKLTRTLHGERSAQNLGTLDADRMVAFGLCVILY